MNKIEILAMVKKLAYNENYEILSGDIDKPVHIRIAGKCDVWGTGTFLKLGTSKFIRREKGLIAFAKLMNKGVTPESIQLSMRQEINGLKKDLLNQSHTIEKQGARVFMLETHVQHLTECLEDLHQVVIV